MLALSHHFIHSSSSKMVRVKTKPTSTARKARKLYGAKAMERWSRTNMEVKAQKERLERVRSLRANFRRWIEGFRVVAKITELESPQPVVQFAAPPSPTVVQVAAPPSPVVQAPPTVPVPTAACPPAALPVTV